MSTAPLTYDADCVRCRYSLPGDREDHRTHLLRRYAEEDHEAGEHSDPLANPICRLCRHQLCRWERDEAAFLSGQPAS